MSGSTTPSDTSPTPGNGGIDTHNDENAWLPWWKSEDTRLVHFIGKDNVPFHAILFPTYLMGQGDFILANDVVGNEYLNVMNRETGKEEKGSKSKGQHDQRSLVRLEISAADAIPLLYGRHHARIRAMPPSIGTNS